jgi:two-component system phosphate regulon sensor histidine kinase PhoR
VLASLLSSLWPLLAFGGGIALVLIQFWWQERRSRALKLEAHRRYTEDALRQQRDAFARFHAQQQTLFNSMIEGVLLVDADGKVLLVNESLRKLLPFPAEIRGKTIAEAFKFPPLTELAQQLKADKNIFDAELEIPGTPPRTLQVNAAIVMDQDQERGEIFVFHDVTRLKQLENLRREFVANVSHELRTPLSLIRGFTETLLDGAKDNPELNTRFIQKIDKQSSRLLYLIEDLLSISQLESGRVALNIQPVNLRDLAQRVLEDLAAKAAATQATLRNDIPADLLARADAGRLQQVFYNLAENAIKYGKTGGLVTVAARPSGPLRLEVTVSDDGAGIPPESRERIFERFYRVDRARSRETGGTGLGLSIVKHIVQAHGGEVWVESELQKGTTFHFTLDRAND